MSKVDTTSAHWVLVSAAEEAPSDSLTFNLIGSFIMNNATLFEEHLAREQSDEKTVDRFKEAYAAFMQSQGVDVDAVDYLIQVGQSSRSLPEIAEHWLSEPENQSYLAEV